MLESQVREAWLGGFIGWPTVVRFLMVSKVSPRAFHGGLGKGWSKKLEQEPVLAH